jgi:hypothetical protein
MTALRPWTYAFFVTLALAGCAGMSGRPVPEAALPDLSPIRRALQADCLDPKPSSGADDDEKRRRRNGLVSAYMAGADLRYHAYERGLLASSRRREPGAALARRMRAPGAGADGRALSEATNPAGGAVAGPRAVVARGLLDRTIGTLQTQMRALRQRQLAANFARFALPYAQWHACQALQDAVAYEQAGTLNAALAAMAASAEAEEREARAEVEAAIRATGVASGTARTALHGFVYPRDRILWPERLAVARRIVAAGNLLPEPGLSPGARLSRILDLADPDREPDRRALIRGILDDPHVAESLKAPLRAALAG